VNLFPSGRARLPRGTRYRLEDGPDRLSEEQILQDDLEVEIMLLGGAYDVFERDDGEWLYLERLADLVGLE